MVLSFNVAWKAGKNIAICADNDKIETSQAEWKPAGILFKFRILNGMLESHT